MRLMRLKNSQALHYLKPIIIPNILMLTSMDIIEPEMTVMTMVLQNSDDETSFMTEPPAKRQARCIEDYCEELRALLVKRPDFWDYKAIENVLSEISRFYCRAWKKIQLIKDSTFKYSIPILISRKNLPPDVINSLLKILNELAYTEWKNYYRSFVVDNFVLIPQCYLLSLKFLIKTNSREDQAKIPLTAVQKVFSYLESRAVAKKTSGDGWGHLCACQRRSVFMTEPPVKRRARCIESYCDDLRGLLARSPDLWDFKEIQKILNDIFRLYCKSPEMIQNLKDSTFPYSFPILISRENLPPAVINNLLQILVEMKPYDKIFWNECYGSFVIDNFLPLPACYLQSLRFLNSTICKNYLYRNSVPLSAVQEVFHYIESKMSSKRTLPKNDILIYVELAKMIGNFGYGDTKWEEEFVPLLNSVAELNSQLHCLDGDTLLSISKQVLSYIDRRHMNKFLGNLKKTLADLVDERCARSPGNLAKLYVYPNSTTLCTTAEAKRDKVFVSVLKKSSAENGSYDVIKALRDINRNGYPIAGNIYRALSSFISEPGELACPWANASREALFVFLARGEKSVSDKFEKRRLNEVIIKFLRALRDLACDTDQVKEVVAKVTRDVIELAEDTVFRDNALTDDHITLVMDLFAKYGTWFSKYFKPLHQPPSSFISCQSLLWHIYTHPVLKGVGAREIRSIEDNLDLRKFGEFGFVTNRRKEEILSMLSDLRDTSPNDYLVKLSEFFLAKCYYCLYYTYQYPRKEKGSKSLVQSVCEIIDLHEDDPPELLLRLFLCLVRYFQSAQAEFGQSREEKQINHLHPSKNEQVEGMIKILGEEGAPGVEVTEQNLSSPILKSMLASSFEEGRTRTITVPSASQRILEALKLILSENGKGVEEHATLKEVWEWMLPWATMYQVDGVFKYLVHAMSRDNQSKDSIPSDEWLIEFAIRNVINSLLKILNELAYTEWKNYYRSFVVDNFVLIPQCYLLSLKFLNKTNSREDQAKIPLTAVQKVFSYLESRAVAKKTLTKNDKLIFTELTKVMNSFSLAEEETLETFLTLVVSVTDFNARHRCLEGHIVLKMAEQVYLWLSMQNNLCKPLTSGLVEKLNKTLGVLMEEICDLCPNDLAKLFKDADSGAKMTLYKTAEESRNKAFVSVLKSKWVNDSCVNVIEAVRKINRKGLPIAEEIYQALSALISEPRDSKIIWAKASRDALYIFLERGKLRVSEESQKKQLHEVIIKFLGILRDLDCTGSVDTAAESVKEVARCQCLLHYPNRLLTVFRDSINKDHITLVMDLFAKYGTWFTKSFTFNPCRAYQWYINTHPLLSGIGLRKIHKLRKSQTDHTNFWNFFVAMDVANKEVLRELTELRENFPEGFLAELSDILIIAGWNTEAILSSVWEKLDLRESDPPEFLLRLFLCLVRYLQGVKTKFEEPREVKNKSREAKSEQGEGMWLVLESSPILKSMLASSFEEGRTRAITVPSAPQHILEALKLILGEDGKGVEEHATLKEVWEWMLPWATMYQVDGVFNYLVQAMSEKNATISDEWMVEFAIRSKHPAWLMLISNRFLLIETLNVPPQDLIFAITELVTSLKDKENYLVNIISYFCTQKCSDLGERELVPNIRLTPTDRYNKGKYFDHPNCYFGESDESHDDDSEEERGYWY
eukprot:sb/3460755/